MKVEGSDISTKHCAICTQSVGVFMFSLRFWQQNEYSNYRVTCLVEHYSVFCEVRTESGLLSRYGLGGRGIESRWGEIFRPSRPALGPTQCNGFRVFPGGKVRPGRAADHSPSSCAAVMEEWSYTSAHPLGHNRACKGNTLPLFFYELNHACAQCKPILVLKRHGHSCIHVSNRIRSRYSSVRGEQDSKLLTAGGKSLRKYLTVELYE